MTEPTTKAGRALAERAKREAFGNWEGIAQFEIPAIEREARAEGAAAAVARIRDWLGRYLRGEAPIFAVSGDESLETLLAILDESTDRGEA